MRLEINLLVNQEDLSKLNFDPRTDNFFIVGSPRELGSWNIQNAVLLKPIDQSNKWSTVVEDETFFFYKLSYKYFMTRKCDNEMFLNKVELNNHFYENSFSDKNHRIDDEWSNERTTNGWLLNNQFELQLNFFDKPLNVKNTISDQHNLQVTSNQDNILVSYVVRVIL